MILGVCLPTTRNCLNDIDVTMTQFKPHVNIVTTVCSRNPWANVHVMMDVHVARRSDITFTIHQLLTLFSRRIQVLHATSSSTCLRFKTNRPDYTTAE